MTDAGVRSQTEIAALTGLRGFAALWVLLFHVWGASGPRRMLVELGGVTLDFTPFFSIGWAGVQVFFVLSGFLLALPFVDWCAARGARPPTLPYLARRCARVVPGYYLQLGLLVLLIWYLDGQMAIGGLGEGLGYLGMMFVPGPLGVPMLNDVWWTLPIEFSFYVALPLWMLALRRWGAVVALGGALAVMVAWRWLTIQVWAADMAPGQRFLLGYQFPGSMDSFALGVAAAVLWQHPSVSAWLKERSSRSEVLAVSGLLCAGSLLYWMHFGYRAYWTLAPLTFLWTPLFCAAIAAVVVGAASGSRLLRCLLANPVVHYLGVISYGIYLWHNPILRWIGSSGVFVEGYVLPWLLLSCTGGAVMAAALSWHLVEQPVILRVRRWMRNGKAPPMSLAGIAR